MAAIQETHLKPNSKFKPENSFVSYDIIRKDRLFRKAGGLMIVIRKDLIYNEKILQPYPNGKLEVQVVTIKEKSYDLDIMNVYNAPNNTIDKTEFLHYKNQLSRKFYIVGDLNAHHPQWEPSKNIISNGSGRTIESIVNDLNNNILLATPPDLPTCTDVRTGKTSTIDLMLCPPVLLNITNIVTLGDLGSDHTPLLAVAQINPDTIPRGKKPKWKLKEENWERWYQKVENFITVPTENTREEVKNFTNSLISPSKECFKKSSSKVTDRYNKYWWNPHCAKATALRRRAMRLMEKRPTLLNINSYKRLSAAATRVHKTAKRLAWRSYIETITEKTTTAEIWRVIKAFKGRNYQIRSPIEDDEENLIYDIQEKAEKHVNHLQKTMYSDILFDYTNEELRSIDVAANNNSETDYNIRFKIHELENAVSNLKPDKAFGADDIHNRFIIKMPPIKTQELLGVINRIWRKGEVPDEWKLAQVIPILKPGKNPKKESSYRPISLLSCLSKVMEKMVSDRLSFYVEYNNLLRSSQYGFRANRSTIDPLISIDHKIRASLVNRKVTILVFFDLKSAFDTVNHIELFKTLVDLGVKGRMLTWLISFLSNRKIQVILEDKVSNIYNINTGVPQGSILGPILFIICYV